MLILWTLHDMFLLCTVSLIFPTLRRLMVSLSSTLGGDLHILWVCHPHSYTIDDLFFIFFGGLWEEMKDFMQDLDGGAVFEMTPEEACRSAWSP